MAEQEQPLLDGPIPGMSMTHEIGARAWQQPAQFTTVEEALDYYIPRLESEEVTSSLLDVLEMGIPVTTVANTMQLSGVMEGKHSVDVGMLILPVLVELIMMIGDSAGIKYTSGLEKGKELRSSTIDLAIEKMRKQKEIPEAEDEPVELGEIVVAEERSNGLMSRRTQ